MIMKAWGKSTLYYKSFFCYIWKARLEPQFRGCSNGHHFPALTSFLVLAAEWGWIMRLLSCISSQQLRRLSERRPPTSYHLQRHILRYRLVRQACPRQDLQDLPVGSRRMIFGSTLGKPISQGQCSRKPMMPFVRITIGQARSRHHIALVVRHSCNYRAKSPRRWIHVVYV